MKASSMRTGLVWGRFGIQSGGPDLMLDAESLHAHPASRTPSARIEYLTKRATAIATI